MALPLPNLDDRTFDDITEEARSLIPRYCPEWTNQNPSDPGITLIELFAWLTESVIYRTNQIPESTFRTCLRLLMGKASQPADGSPETLDAAFVRATRYISDVKRAVTHDDYDFLAMESMKNAGFQGRAVCMINRDFTKTNLQSMKPSHVSVVIIPQGLNGSGNLDYFTTDDKGNLVPTDSYAALLKKVADDLDIMRIITHRVHVVAPCFLKVTIEAGLALAEGADADTVKTAAVKRLVSFCDPVGGGPEGKGWKVGRALYRSELFELLEGIDGVDHTCSIALKSGEDTANPKSSAMRQWIAWKAALKATSSGMIYGATSDQSSFGVAINQFIEWSPEPKITIMEE